PDERINTDAATNTPHDAASTPQRSLAASNRVARNNPNMLVQKYGKSENTNRVENQKMMGEELSNKQMPAATARPCSRRRSSYVAMNPSATKIDIERTRTAWPHPIVAHAIATRNGNPGGIIVSCLK